MNAPTLIHELRSAGVVLQADGDKVRFHPRDAVSVEQVEHLRRHKAEVLAVLDGEVGESRPGPLTAGGNLTERYTASPDERLRAWVRVTPGVRHAVDDVTGLPV